MELACPPDSSASVSKAEPISIFCNDAQCENIAFACDRNSKVTNNDVIIEVLKMKCRVLPKLVKIMVSALMFAGVIKVIMKVST